MKCFDFASSRKCILLVRICLSLFAVFHLGIVAIRSIYDYQEGTDGVASPYIKQMTNLFYSYLDATFFNMGFPYFHNPGSNPVVFYEVQFSDGTKVKNILADKRTQIPRLLYHRYFMLSGMLYQDWLNDSERYNKKKSTIINVLSRYYPQAKATTIKILLHRQPTPEEFAAGIGLEDSSLYSELGVSQ